MVASSNRSQHYHTKMAFLVDQRMVLSSKFVYCAPCGDPHLEEAFVCSSGSLAARSTSILCPGGGGVSQNANAFKGQKRSRRLPVSKQRVAEPPYFAVPLSTRSVLA